MTDPALSHLDGDLRLRFHRSQRPARVRQRLTKALQDGVLPARFLYDSPAQAARWLAYHAAWSPSRTEQDLLALYRVAFDFTLDGWSAPELKHVSLGCGGGRKDALFAEAARAQGLELRAVLSDTSPSLVMEALALNPAPAEGLVIDLESRPAPSAFVSEGPTLWTAFGMVPNLDAERFLSWLSTCLTGQDRALVSANLHPAPWPAAGPAILPQYDNPEARAWYRGALAELGFDRPEIQVTGRSKNAEGSVWRVEVKAVPSEPGTLVAFDQRFALQTGEPFSVFFSNRFTPEAFEATLVAAGLRPIERWRFAGDEEGLWLVGPPETA